MELGRFRVDRMSAHKTPMPAMVAGEEVMADVHIMEVVLVNDDASHGTLTLRLLKASERQSITELAQEGDVIVLSADKTTTDAAQPDVPAETGD